MKKQNKIFIIVLVISLISLTIVSGLVVKYYYSPSCPHCQRVNPLVSQLRQQFPEVDWQIYNVNEVPNPYSQGVPAIVIDEEMIIVGSLEIPKRLRCEVQQMSTKECQTYSADHSIGKGESWFKD